VTGTSAEDAVPLLLAAARTTVHQILRISNNRYRFRSIGGLFRAV
jgi:hypothetical protein